MEVNEVSMVSPKTKAVIVASRTGDAEPLTCKGLESMPKPVSTGSVRDEQEVREAS